MSKSSKKRFHNHNSQRDCTKTVTEKIAIEYDNMIASDYEQYQ
jgi:hypothetical protein